MNVKVTMKVGDEVQVMDEEHTKMFAGNEAGFEQLLQGKGALTMLTKMLDVMNPSEAGKRIELIVEFDDGEYIVMGRKPKEKIADGR